MLITEKGRNPRSAGTCRAVHIEGRHRVFETYEMNQCAANHERIPKRMSAEVQPTKIEYVVVEGYDPEQFSNKLTIF